MEDTQTYNAEVEDQQPPQEEPPKKLSVKDFAAQIKEKYPAYKNMDDTELANKIIEKYPVYKDQIDFGEQSKKKDFTNGGAISKNGGVIDQNTEPDKSVFSKGIEPTVDNLFPLEKQRLAKNGIFLMPPDEQKKVIKDVISNRQYEQPAPKKSQGNYVPEKVIPQAVGDMTVMQKPITSEDIEQKKQAYQQHKIYLDKAIDNTTDRYFAAKGQNVTKGSPLWNEKRQKLQQDVANGDATLHIKDGVPGLDRKTGFFEGLSKGFKEALNSNDEAAAFVHDMDTKDRVDFLNKQQNIQNKSEYLGENNGLGHFIGGAVPFLVKAGAGATVGTGLAALAPETGGASLEGLPVAASFLFTAPDMANQEGMNETIRRYNDLKRTNPELSDYDAMRQAESGLIVGGAAGIASNALMMGTMKAPISMEGKNVLKKFIAGTANSGINMGASTAAADVAEKLEGAAEGYKTTPSEVMGSAANKFIDNATVGMALHGIMQGIAGVAKLPKQVNSALKYSLKDTPTQDIAETLNDNVKAGNISPEVADKTIQDIDGYKKALEKTSPMLSPESQASVAGLIQAKDNIAKEMETKDAPQHFLYKSKIDALDNQIKQIIETNKPLEHEVDDVTGLPLEKPQFDETASKTVSELAQDISKGKPITDAQKIQAEHNFPEQLSDELNNILKEEKSKNKDKENPNTEISDNIESYLKNKENERNNAVAKPVEGTIPTETTIPEGQENKGTIPTSTEPTGQGNAETTPAVLTKEAEDLLASIKEGSKPTFITKNLERIANENGIEVTDKMSADDVINALKEKQSSQSEPNKALSSIEKGNDWEKQQKEIDNNSELSLKEKAKAKIESTQSAISNLSEEQFNQLKNKVGNFDAKTIAEKYHFYKETGSNPELVKAVEDLIGSKEKPTPEIPKEPINDSDLFDTAMNEIYKVNENGEFKKANVMAENQFRAKYGEQGAKMIDVFKNFKKYAEQMGIKIEC